MNLRTSSLLSALLLAGTASPALAQGTWKNGVEPAPGNNWTATRVLAGTGREYRIHGIPGIYAVNNPAPVVINFHGWGSSAAEQAAASGMEATADAKSFVAVHPEGLIGDDNKQSWNAGDCC